MDDFGSEYSTLNLLEELDFDLIKIDMKFMKNFTASSKNYIIISDIIDMARRMGITTLIEGVESWVCAGCLPPNTGAARPSWWFRCIVRGC